MASKIDLDKIVYKRIEDGQHTLTIKSWNLRVAKTGDEFVELSAQLDETDRIVKIPLFEQGLSITLANVSNHLELEELSAGEILNEMKDKTLPAFHDTVKENGQTYYNWYICSEPRQVQPTEVVAPADEAPEF